MHQVLLRAGYKMDCQRFELRFLAVHLQNHEHALRYCLCASSVALYTTELYKVSSLADHS